jgi:hypothetical protein
VRRKARKQEGDQTGKPLKQIRKVFAHKMSVRTSD